MVWHKVCVSRRFVLVILAASLATGIHVTAGEAASGRLTPNILLAVSDDQSWVHASAYGCSGLETPGLDRVAREGVVLANAFSAAPMCTVSRACLLTGRNHWQNREAGTHWSVFPRDLTVYPQLLERSGYEVGYTGKGWSPGSWEQTGWPHNPAGEEFNRTKCAVPASGIKNIDYAANFAAFLDQKPNDRPFCFWYGAYEPHGPYERGSGRRLGKRLSDVVLPPFLEDTQANRDKLLDIFVEIEWFDRHLARMLDTLEHHGELDNTLIVVTGDNGTSINHAKGNLYEYGVHVPMVVSWPACVPAGRIIEDLVSFIDLAPTFLEAAGLAPPEEMTGRSILNALTATQEGPVNATRTRVLLGQERGSHKRFDNLGYPMCAIRTPQYLYIWNLKPDRWPQGDPALFLWGKYGSQDKDEFRDGLPADWRRRPTEELFHIADDPACMKNLADDPAFETIRKRLQRTLREELVSQKDPRLLGYGDIFESYPRFGVMRPECGGFAERGEYNPKYQIEIPPTAER